MSDIAWSRKYRPSSFDEYMGDNVKRMVLNRFKDRSSIPNTIMLYGTRGTGKTSMARLLSKEILCMSPVEGHSCGQCEMCVSMNEYITSTEAGAECYGITEVDAATTTGKNDINDIIEEALIEPLYPLSHKILIMDECHMLSKAAQNSLLKVIEEPPAHLVFILCTTDPDQVIPTIHSRMQLKIEVRKKSVEEMAKRLLEISEKEKLKTSMEALRLIAKKGDRVPRECINLLESIAKNNGNEVTLENVQSSVGDVDTDLYVEYFQACNKDLESILLFNKKLKALDVNAKRFISGLARFMLDACYIKYGIELEEYSLEVVQKIEKVFKLYKSTEFDMALQIVESAIKNVGEDDSKGELLITTTALRIGKLGLLASGLKDTVQQAERENKKSLENYKAKVGEDTEGQLDRIMEQSPSVESLNPVFDKLTDIAGSEGLLPMQFDGEAESDKKEGEHTDCTLTRSELEKLIMD